MKGVWTNYVDPDQMSQSMKSVQVLQLLHLQAYFLRNIEEVKSAPLLLAMDLSEFLDVNGLI